MTLTDQEMTTLLGLLSKASQEQLIKANQHVRGVLDTRARQATYAVRVGTRVQWNGKQGHKIGTVLKVKQKYVEVKEEITPGTYGIGMTWNVPASMLSPAPSQTKP